MYTAFVFAGQGVQFISTVSCLYVNFSTARDAFHDLNDTILEKLTNILFSDPAPYLYY